MVIRGAVVVVAGLAALLAAARARADSPRLADARRAVEAVDYDAARRLLVEALRDGDNSPAAMREIYRLSARAAVVLDQRELAEQYYRRWLAIDPDAALPADTAPKLREPFVAAEAYVAAHGRLRARAQRAATGEVDVELLADPLAMAHAAAAIDAPSGPAAEPIISPTPAPAVRSAAAPVAFGAEHRVRLATAARVAIVDEAGNRLLELDPEPAAAPPPPATTRSTPWPQRWQTWAIPGGVFALGAAGFGIAAIASYGTAQKITGESGSHTLSDAQDNVRRGKIFVWVTIASGAVAAGFAIPTAIYYSRGHDLRRLIALPIAGPDHVGVAVAGRF